MALWGLTNGSEHELATNARLVDLTTDIANACGADRVFHMSSAAVYGPGANLSEDQAPCPINPYGRAKLDMERRVAELRDNSRSHHVILRLANVVGADSLAPGLRANLAVKLDRFDDGHGPRRSYIAASDFLRIVTRLTELERHHCPDILNIAAPQPVEMEGLLRAAGREVLWCPAPARAVQDVTLDVGRLGRLLPLHQLMSKPADLVADWQELERRR